MPRGVILVDWTDQGRRSIKEAPDRAEACKAEAARLGVQITDLFFTPGGPHDAAIVVGETSSRASIGKFMSSEQSKGAVRMQFIRAYSIDEMREIV